MQATCNCVKKQEQDMSWAPDLYIVVSTILCKPMKESRLVMI